MSQYDEGYSKELVAQAKKRYSNISEREINTC